MFVKGLFTKARRKQLRERTGAGASQHVFTRRDEERARHSG